MSSVVRKYAGYTTDVGDDAGTTVVEEVAPGIWARFHCRIYRIPSQRIFRLKHCVDATAEDRDHALRLLARMPDGAWLNVPQAMWFRHKSQRGNFHYWQSFLGRFLDDPLVQLELEMMIDIERGTTRDPLAANARGTVA